MNNIEIIIPKEVWINSYLSIARYYGGIRINGEEYSIVPPDGDLVARKWVGVYKKAGREKTIEFARRGISVSAARKAVRSINLSGGRRKRDTDDESNVIGGLFSNNNK